MSPESGSSGASARRAALADLLRGLVPALALGWFVGTSLGRGVALTLLVTLVYAAAGATILRARPRAFPGEGMGGANRITLARLVLGLAPAALLLHPGALDDAARWWIVGIGTLALALDGVDGWWARRTGTGSEFGARFDMETDAALLLVLSGLAWRSGAVGPWVWGIGAMRYLFVAAGRVWPALEGELAPSMRRKVVCVVQGIALLIALGPIVPTPLAGTIVAAALVSLIASFAIDTRALVRDARAQASSPSIAA